MKRRKFLKHTSRAISIPVLLNGVDLAAIPQSSLFSAIDNESDRVLVLLQLNGGNDGLSMLVPTDQYENLLQVRENIMLPEDSLLPITDTAAFHPQMVGLQNMYNDGLLGLVQGAGYPNQNRSHFRSTDIWTSASAADETWSSGWLGRHLDGLHPTFPEGYPNDDCPHPFAITMGSSIVSNTCQGVAANYSLALEDPFSLSAVMEGEGGEIPDTPYGDELQFIRTSIAQTNAYAEVVTAAADLGANTVDYPEDNRFARQLKNVALLISGGLQTKIYVVSLGGFDTHAEQALPTDTTNGAHAELLSSLSEAMSIFQADLMGLGVDNRVLSMTFSEFGRRIRSNDSLGTDHGTAAPLMLFGSCVNGQVLGENPEISADVGIQEGVPMQYDFRDIYGSVLMDWFSVEEDTVRELLYQEFTHLPILADCSSVVSTGSEPALTADISLEVFPNPAKNWLTIRFECEAEWARIALFDGLGSEIRTIANRQFPTGRHDIRVDLSQLPAGAYFARLQMTGRAKTMRFVKM